jgi:hypothetical protein
MIKEIFSSLSDTFVVWTLSLERSTNESNPSWTDPVVSFAATAI